jgi:hypothetical protein
MISKLTRELATTAEEAAEPAPIRQPQIRDHPPGSILGTLQLVWVVSINPGHRQAALDDFRQVITYVCVYTYVLQLIENTTANKHNIVYGAPTAGRLGPIDPRTRRTCTPVAPRWSGGTYRRQPPVLPRGRLAVAAVPILSNWRANCMILLLVFQTHASS